MDKRSIIGLLIIGGILFAFSYFTAEKPTGDKKTKTEQTDSTAQVTDTLLTNVVDTFEKEMMWFRGSISAVLSGTLNCVGNVK